MRVLQTVKQGTVSVLFGCHNIKHSFFVIIAWVILHKRLPRPWQLVCILLHDIGHWGLDYLDKVEDKNRHWMLGAKIAFVLFGNRGYELVAGHCAESGHPPSDMHKPDKYSWLIQPTIFYLIDQIFEPKLKMGYGRLEAVRKFKAQVRENVESGEYRSTHDLYLERCRGR